MLGLEKRVHGVTPSEHARLRDAELAAGRASNMARTGAPTGIEWGNVWADAFGTAIETRADADAAIALLPQYQPIASRPLRPPYVDEALARAYILAERPDEAMPFLEHATRLCYVFDDTPPVVRSWYWLGQARELKNDVAGACGAYATVLSHWGSAKPRSVTADLARARVKALACGK
jgi:serine/threonine-protein kinase